MTKVGVLGARGRMGREVVRTVTEAPDLEVVAEVDQGDPLDALAGCDVVVDFTHPGVVMENLRWCAAGWPGTRASASWSCRTSLSVPS